MKGKKTSESSESLKLNLLQMRLKSKINMAIEIVDNHSSEELHRKLNRQITVPFDAKLFSRTVTK